MNKRGYYFITDALIAAMILAIGFFLVSSFYISDPGKLEIKAAADNIMNFLSTTKFYDLCSGEPVVCSNAVLEDLSRQRVITNKDNSLLEVIGELFFKNKIKSVSKLIDSIIVENKMIPQGYNFTFFIADNVVYPPEQFEFTREDPVMKKSKALVTSKKIIFGYFEGSIIYWGPYTAEARVWRLEHFIRCKTDKDCFGGECDQEYCICTDHVVKAGEACWITCNDDRFVCVSGICMEKKTDIFHFCANEASCGPGLYCIPRIGCVSTPGDVNDPCGYNDDCNAKLFCDDGKCSFAESKEGDDCSGTGKCGIGLYCCREGLSCETGKCFYSNTVNPGYRGETGDYCDSDTDCIGLCNLKTLKCEEGRYNKGDSCDSQEECGPGLICNINRCGSANCVAESVCGNDQDCNVGLSCYNGRCKFIEENQNCIVKVTPPSQCNGAEVKEECITTNGKPGDECVSDLDCDCGNYCDNGYCYNGKSEPDKTGCSSNYDCGVGQYCENNVCKNTGICSGCSSQNDCSGQTYCDLGVDNVYRCHRLNNEGGSCGLNDYSAYCDCGPGLICLTAINNTCYETCDYIGCQCDKDSDCHGQGLKCIEHICTDTGVNQTAVCGDGWVSFLTEQCDGDTTTCEEIGCSGGVVNCNPPGSEDECRWDKSVCDPGSCPVCDFPADCKEDCTMLFDETQTLFNFWKINKDYYCGGTKEENLITPTIKLTQCSLTLYSLGNYDTTWSFKPKCSGIS